MRKKHSSQRRDRGFSLIELMIVVGIILVIAAISMANYMRSRIAANEASAVASLKVINTAQISYATAYPKVGYADSLAKLGPVPANTAATSLNAGLLDSILGCANPTCQKTGYQFSITNVTNGNFTLLATPITPQSGTRGFCSDQLSHMTYDPNGGTNCTMPLQ